MMTADEMVTTANIPEENLINSNARYGMIKVGNG